MDEVLIHCTNLEVLDLRRVGSGRAGEVSLLLQTLADGEMTSLKSLSIRNEPTWFAPESFELFLTFLARQTKLELIRLHSNS